MSKLFWICLGILIGVILATSVGFLAYIINCTRDTKITQPCTPFTIGNWFDLSVLIIGTGAVIILTWYANSKGCVNEKYFMALLAFLVFIMYGLSTYDIQKQECKSFRLCFGQEKQQENSNSQSTTTKE